MRIESRINVLTKSLEIENALSDVIKAIIKIPKIDTKTLGNQSSSLSFKTKADLLYDLNRISKEEYNRLILFMEIRNQFIHNIDADSFIKVFEILGSSKKNKLLQLDENIASIKDMIKEGNDTEKILGFGFDSLSIKLMETIISLRETILKEFETEREQENLKIMHDISMDMLYFVQETVEEFGDIWTEQLEKSGVKTDFKNLITSYIHQKSIEKIRTKYPDLPEPL